MTSDLRDNTLILVMSDNGHEDGAGSSDPLRGAKTWLYEGGIRSPSDRLGAGVAGRRRCGHDERHVDPVRHGCQSFALLADERGAAG